MSCEADAKAWRTKSAVSPVWQLNSRRRTRCSHGVDLAGKFSQDVENDSESNGDRAPSTGAESRVSLYSPEERAAACAGAASRCWSALPRIRSTGTSVASAQHPVSRCAPGHPRLRHRGDFLPLRSAAAFARSRSGSGRRRLRMAVRHGRRRRADGRGQRRRTGRPAGRTVRHTDPDVQRRQHRDHDDRIGDADRRGQSEHSPATRCSRSS